MIQEVVGSGGGERKMSIPFPCLPSAKSSPTKPANPSNIGKNNSNPENSNTNLKCPRCDSTNTKFCYYNNYNLTQPRHFCKTCRRYWTKGGTLRNVPIGGGCRKNKTTLFTSSSSSSATSSGLSMSSNANKAATEMILNDLLPQTLIPPLWPSIPHRQSSHILALLRGPNPNPIFTHLKTEGTTSTHGLDPYGAGPPSILGSHLRAGNPHPHPLNGFGLGAQDVIQNGPGNSILELYQRLKTSTNYNYCGFENPVALMGSSSAMNSSILEGSSNGATDLMTSPGIWSDFPTLHINAAFP